MTEKQEENKCNISFFFDDNDTDTDNENTEVDISFLLNELKNIDLQNSSDLYVPNIVNYHENFKVKELLLICEYYGIVKELKLNKQNKEQIIHFLVGFETNPDNADIVCERKNMWFYINELKHNKFMKKYVLW